MDPYEILGITPEYAGSLRAVRNLLAKRYFEAGETPDEERMKAINLAYELLSQPVAPEPLSIVTGALPHARAGEAYRARLAARGGSAPYAWEAVLPTGLALDASGAIHGRPARTGSFPVTLDVADRDGRQAQRVVVLHVEPAPLRVLGDALPNATIGVPYEAEVPVEGGVAPLHWSGKPPAGLQWGDGVLFGTPRGPSAALSVEVLVRDAARQTARASCVLVVRPAAAAGDATQWTPDRLADELHAEAVRAHEAGLDVAATRARIAVLERRLARGLRGHDALAAAILGTAAGATVLALLVGAIAIALAATAVIYIIGPALLAPARRTEIDRLRARLGCGRAGCARCRAPQTMP
jgi:Putative Ig domain